MMATADPTVGGSRNSGTGPVGIVAALQEEIRPLRRKLAAASRVRLAKAVATRGRLGGREIVVMATGDGSRRAESGLAQLLGFFDLESVVTMGIAGALSTDLEVGSVVVAERILDGIGEVPAPDPVLLARARRQTSIRTGTVLSHEEIAVDPVMKERLWRQAGEISVLVVDLESASYARTAAARRVPYLVLRAVSDGHDEAMPMDFNRYRKADGSSDRGRITRHALLHPSVVPELMQLRERLHDCAERLAVVVEELLAR